MLRLGGGRGVKMWGAITFLEVLVLDLDLLDVSVTGVLDKLNGSEAETEAMLSAGIQEGTDMIEKICEQCCQTK